MSRRKPDHIEFGQRPSALFAFVRRCCARSGERHNQTSTGLRPIVFRIATFVTLCALTFVCCGAEISRAQVPEAEKAGYADALAYCRGDVARPMALRSDKRVLCLDGQVFAMSEIWLVSGLEQGGLFVVRSHGGDIAIIIQLAEMLLLKQATVIVSDYCLAVCADYLFIASTKTVVPKDSLVAWINHATGPNNCLRFSETGDHGAPRLKKAPCVVAFVDSQTTKLMRLKYKFYNGRVFSPPFLEPPESVAVRRALKRKFDATGRHPDDVYWTWNPRHYAGAIRTKVLYEAYPQSQDEVDAIVKRIGLPSSVIYDP